MCCIPLYIWQLRSWPSLTAHNLAAVRPVDNRTAAEISFMFSTPISHWYWPIYLWQSLQYKSFKITKKFEYLFRTLVEIKVGFIYWIDVNFIISIFRVYYSYVDNEFFPVMVHESWFSISSILFSNISYPFFCKWQIGLLSTKQASSVFTSDALHKCCLSASARLVEDRWDAGWSPRELRHLHMHK